MSNLYILVDGNPVPESDVVAWARWFEISMQERIVERTEIPAPHGEILVSTVFLALDHNHSPCGEPILWETRVFGLVGDEPVQRYSSLEEARAGHKKWVKWAEQYRAESPTESSVTSPPPGGKDF